MSTPYGNGWTRCRSPDSLCPASARAATPHSILDAAGIALIPGTRMESPRPLLHRHRRPMAHFGDDLEFIHQPFRAWQTEAQPLTRREAVLHGAGDVRDSRPLVASHPGDAALVPFLSQLHLDLALPGMDQDVPGHLG